MAFKLAGHRIRFPRIPFFRVFYSLTYTILYFVTLVFLAITPASMIYSAIIQSAIQYVVMIGGAYILTAILAIIIYSSRLYTNRSTLSAVGKAYIPIEAGEIGGTVRKMIVKQLERSAIVAWESRPRDLFGEILLAEQEGVLPPETKSVNKNDYEVGTEIRVDPQNPPWGDVQHPGWSSPSHTDDNKTPEVQFDNVIQELPHLIEARAVSLAPVDPTMTPTLGEQLVADPLVVDALRRPANMALRDYLTQLSYLGLIHPPIVGQTFLSQYERARFSGQPISTGTFNKLMAAFAEVLAGMTTLDDAVIREIRIQTIDRENSVVLPELSLHDATARSPIRTPSPTAQSPPSSMMSPVTAPEGLSSRATTPYLQRAVSSEESFSSVIHNTPEEITAGRGRAQVDYASSTMSSELPSDSGSVIIHDIDASPG